MASLKQTLQSDLKDALRSGQQDAILVLRLVQGAILNKEKEKRTKLAKENPDWSSQKLEEASLLTDEEIIEVLFSEAKKRRESIDAFARGGRQDLVQRESRELEIIQKYLPEQLSEEEIKKLAEAAIQQTGASGPKDMGKVMAELMPKVKGRAAGGIVGRIVRELLESLTNNESNE